MEGWEIATLLRDIVASAFVALAWATVAWLLPFSGVPVLGLIAGPFGLAALAALGFAPVLIGSFRQPAGQALAGAVLLLLGGGLIAGLTLQMTMTAHVVALEVMRGATGWGGAALRLAPWLIGLVVPWGIVAAGLTQARGLRIGWALLVAALIAAVAPATANLLFVYAALGLPLSA